MAQPAPAPSAVAVDVADELEREMKAAWRRPARPVEAGLELRERILGDFGERKGGEKPVHGD